MSIIRTNCFFSKAIIFLALASIVNSLDLSDLTSSLLNSTSDDSTNATYNFTQLIAENGFTTEEHTVTTDDGYILTMFRMYKGDKYEETDKTTPVLLVHGLFQDSGCWIDSGLDAGLAYNLSGAGYDTWIGNTRGNLFSMGHVSLDANVDNKYWEYSIDEIGSIDIPAMIDYILNVTNKEKLNYVGFSQGGTTGLIAFSQPEQCSKVGVFIALAPATTFIHTTSLLKPLVEEFDDLQETLNAAGIYKVFSNESLYSQLNTELSDFFLTEGTTCRPLISALDNPHPDSIEKSAFDNICRHFPAPTGVRNLAGYGQISKAGKFQKYDFGSEENLVRYGTTEPPEYNMTSVCVPVMIGQGPNDPIVALADTEVLGTQLQQLEGLYVANDTLYNHLDMSNSQYSEKILFPKINECLHKYSNASGSS